MGARDLVRAAGPVGLLAAAALLGACRSREPAPPDLPGGGDFEETPSLEVSFEGRRSFDEETLLEVVAADLEGLERRSSVRAALDDAAYTLELHYRARGFPGCTVDYRFEDSSVHERRAVLIVDEGTRVAIGVVRLEGLRAFEARELVPFLKPVPTGLFASETVWYVADELSAGARALESYYRIRGYLDASVTLPEVTPEEGLWPEVLDLDVVVHEGPRYVLRGLELEGGVAEVDGRVDRGAWLGQPLTPRTPRALRGRLGELYGRAGYPDARIELLARDLAPDGAAHLRLRVTPGPRVTIVDLRLEGLERTKPSRVLAAVELEVGAPYDVDLERKSFRNIYKLGAFSSVLIDLEGEGTERTLVVRLEEAPSREFYVEPGYGSYERLRLGFGWRERNLLGGARVLDVSGNVSELAQRGIVGLTDPRLFDTDTSANLALFAIRRQEPSYLSTDLGTALTFARSLNQELELLAAYQFRFSGVESDDLTDPAVLAALDDVNISSITLTPSWDTRDSPFFPSEGAQARVSLEVADEALGSQLDFLRTRWSLAWFEPLGRRSTVGLSWRGGLITPFEAGVEIPLQERFFNGGENTVRSFEEDELGPLDSGGNPIGGEAFNVLTAELRRTLSGRLEGALFYDTGNLLAEASDTFDMEGFRHALGAGLRYVLPVGPLRLDAAWNPDARSTEADYAVHFSVGLSF